jgi:hypothetical protein
MNRWRFAAWQGRSPVHRACALLLFLAHTVPAPKFLDEIHKLGFRVCKILQHGKLELVQPGELLTGHLELLMTRTPEDDIHRVTAQLRRLPFWLKRWLRWTADDLRRLSYRL